MAHNFAFVEECRSGAMTAQDFWIGFAISSPAAIRDYYVLDSKWTSTAELPPVPPGTRTFVYDFENDIRVVQSLMPLGLHS